MNPLLIKDCLEKIRLGLDEDQSRFDFSSKLFSEGPISKRKVRATLVSKSDGVFCGEAIFHALKAFCKTEGFSVEFWTKIKDGNKIKNGQAVLEFNGLTQDLLMIERVVLNLLSRLSGIASISRQYVELVRSASKKLSKTPRVTSTRKLLPGYRSLDLYAVEVGGAYLHRPNLSAGVMLKENHLSIFRNKKTGEIDFSRAVKQAKEVAPHGLKVEIEVTNSSEALAALLGGADVIMLDNFRPKQVVDCIRLLKQKCSKDSIKMPLIEVSGGVREETIQGFCVDGVDLISVGALTHTVFPHDFSLLFKNSSPLRAKNKKRK